MAIDLFEAILLLLALWVLIGSTVVALVGRLREKGDRP